MPPRKAAPIVTLDERDAKVEHRHDFTRRVTEGAERSRRRRQQEAEAEAERERLEKERLGKSDEEENPPATTGQLILNMCLAVVFISFPLSEPDINFSGVAIIAAINVVWNLVFHASTIIHYVTLVLVNIVSLQHYHRFGNLIMAVMSLGPTRLAWYGGANAAAVLLGYIFYVRRTPSHRVGRSWDILISTVLVLNLLSLVAGGTVRWNEVRHIFRGIASLVADMPATGGAGGPGRESDFQHHGAWAGRQGPGPGGHEGPGDEYSGPRPGGAPGQPGGPGGPAGGPGGPGPDGMPRFPEGVDVEFF
jgi:hypothetical protein